MEKRRKQLFSDNGNTVVKHRTADAIMFRRFGTWCAVFEASNTAVALVYTESTSPPSSPKDLEGQRATIEFAANSVRSAAKRHCRALWIENRKSTTKCRLMGKHLSDTEWQLDSYSCLHRPDLLSRTTAWDGNLIVADYYYPPAVYIPICKCLSASRAAGPQAPAGAAGASAAALS